MSDGLGDPLDFEVIVASLRMGREDLSSYLSDLGAKLSRALPGQVQIERAGILGGRNVRALTVEVDGARYEIRDEHGRPACTVASVVRGVVLRADERDVDTWLNELSQSLVRMADASQDARAALGRIIR